MSYNQSRRPGNPGQRSQPAPKQPLSFSGVRTLAETSPNPVKLPAFSACGHTLTPDMALPKTDIVFDAKTKIYSQPSLCFACSWMNTKNIQNRCQEKWETVWRKENQKLATEHAPTMDSAAGVRRFRADEEALSKLYLRRYVDESLDIWRALAKVWDGSERRTAAGNVEMLRLEVRNRATPNANRHHPAWSVCKFWFSKTKPELLAKDSIQYLNPWGWIGLAGYSDAVAGY
jgi:hypothetical protein